MTDDLDGGPAADVSVRETARLRASEVRQQQRRQDRRRRWLLRGGIALAVVGVIVTVTLVIVSFVRPPDRGPLNMLSDGIVIGTELQAVRTPAVRAGDDPVRPDAPEPGVIPIRIYVDYSSPEAGEFETANRRQLEEWLNTGAATLEIHPLALPVSGTTGSGSQYPLRAANAAACVAEYSPDAFFAFNDRLLRQQPEEGGSLDEERILQLARGAQVSAMVRVELCVRQGRFTRWVQEATARAVNGPIGDADLDRITTSPTIILGERRYLYADASDATEFARAFQIAAGENFGGEETPTPTPSPAP